jgi:Methionyl-tRNA formyltransferase
MAKNILYLTNNSNTAGLFEWLKERYPTELCQDALRLPQLEQLKPDIIISYNYKYIIGQELISYMDGRIINLHISLLPWNRGANPNFWSFVDDTPKGVTIHQINAELDKGKILCQKECFFDAEKETFLSTYDKLNETIVALFKENCQDIMGGRIVPREQPSGGSYHSVKDFQEVKSQLDFAWSDNIALVQSKYKTFKEAQMKRE